MFERFKQSFARQPAGRGKKTSGSQYHAVSIIFPSSACIAAKAQVGVRFLATQAPILPVDGCDEASCSCRYRHHDDRREGPRRVQARGVLGPRPLDDERRTSLGRRAVDKRNYREPDNEAADYFSYLTKGR